MRSVAICRLIYIVAGCMCRTVQMVMSDCEDAEFLEAYNRWAEQIESHLKKKNVSAKTKNEMIIAVKGLQATVKSVTKVLSKYIQ